MSTGNEAPERPIVLAANLLPEWVTGQLDDFDLRLADENCDACRSARVLIAGTTTIDETFLDRFPAVEYVAAVASGYENIDVEAARKRGIMVTSNAPAPAADVADHTLGLILTLYLRIPAYDAAIKTNQWRAAQLRRSLPEVKVGIFGLGLIGQGVARRLEPLGCAIRWSGPRHRDTPYEYEPDLIALADWADVLVVTARADASNAGLIGADILRSLGPDGMIVNVSRGSIIDEDALIAMLREGSLGGAALDVFQSEPTPGERWRDVPNTVLTPHMAGYGSGTQRLLQEMLAGNLAAFFSGQPLSGRVD